MRIVNRIRALVVAVALLGVGVVLIVNVILERVGGRPIIFDWHATYRWAARTSWNANSALAISAALAAVGLLMLVGQIVPRRVRRLRVSADNPGTDAAITRRGLSRTVESAVADLDDVKDLRVVVRRRTVLVKAHTRPMPRTPRPGVPPAPEPAAEVTRVARRRLDALRLRRAPKLRVRTANGRG